MRALSTSIPHESARSTPGEIVLAIATRSVPLAQTSESARFSLMILLRHVNNSKEEKRMKPKKNKRGESYRLEIGGDNVVSTYQSDEWSGVNDHPTHQT